MSKKKGYVFDPDIFTQAQEEAHATQVQTIGAQNTDDVKTKDKVMIGIRIAPTMRERLKYHALKTGESTNAMICRLIEKELN